MRDANVKARNGGNHRSTHVRWWQAVSAVVPITLVAGAWGVAITASPGSGSETIDAKLDDTPSEPGTPAITDVPTDAFDKPMAGQVKKNQSGRHPLADVKQAAKSVAASAQSSPLPTPALDAYRSAAKVMADVKASCNLDWTLVAAIGRVESDHGQYGGSRVDTSGVSSPKIIGIPLDGTNETAAIRDTDDGRYDGDSTWDRAVGPMQFIPSTWDLVGVDGNSDGTKDPNNIYDAALASAVYLCADGEDLSTREGASEAVFSYNHSNDYVANVLAIAAAYERGDFSETPGYYPDVDTGPAEGTVFDPQTYDDGSDDDRGDNGRKDEKLLKSTEFGPPESKHSKNPKLLKPIDKHTTKDDRTGKDKSDRPGKDKLQQVEPARPDDQGKGHGLIKPLHLQTGPRDDARPTDPKGNSKPDDVEGFADDRSPDEQRDGSGTGRIEQQQLQQTGPAIEVRPDRDDRAGGKNAPKSESTDNTKDEVGKTDGAAEPKIQSTDGETEPKSQTTDDTTGDTTPKSQSTDENAQPKSQTTDDANRPETTDDTTDDSTQPKTDGTDEVQPEAGDKPRHRGESKPESEPPTGPGVNVRPKHRAESEPVRPKQDTAPTEPKQDTAPTEPKQQTAPTEPKLQTAPAEPKQDTAPTEPKQQTAPTEPKLQTAPAEPKQDTAPTEPKQQTAPTEPKQQTAPAEPKQDTAPAEPKLQTAPTEPKQQTAPATKPKSKTKARQRTDATKTAPASTTYLPDEAQAGTLVARFLNSYALFWSVPEKHGSVDSL